MVFRVVATECTREVVCNTDWRRASWCIAELKTAREARLQKGHTDKRDHFLLLATMKPKCVGCLDVKLTTKRITSRIKKKVVCNYAFSQCICLFVFRLWQLVPAQSFVARDCYCPEWHHYLTITIVRHVYENWREAAAMEVMKFRSYSLGVLCWRRIVNSIVCRCSHVLMFRNPSI